MLILQALLAVGWRRCVRVGRGWQRGSNSRRSLARQTLLYCHDREAPWPEVFAANRGGVGVDVTMEAVGRNETVNAAIASVRKWRDSSTCGGIFRRKLRCLCRAW